MGSDLKLQKKKDFPGNHHASLLWFPELNYTYITTIDKQVLQLILISFIGRVLAQRGHWCGKKLKYPEKTHVSKRVITISFHLVISSFFAYNRHVKIYIHTIRCQIQWYLLPRTFRFLCRLSANVWRINLKFVCKKPFSNKFYMCIDKWTYR